MTDKKAKSDLAKAYVMHSELGIGGRNGVSQNLVKGDGPVPCKIMVIGEAPGATEDEIGRPFVGDAGNVFNKLLGILHLEREDVFVTNVFKYRPPQNRKPYIGEIVQSLPLLNEEIRIINPKYIICLGQTATQTIYPAETVSFKRGKLHKTKKSNRYILCTYHPAAVLYDQTTKTLDTIRSDFQLLADFIENEDSTKD